jgi:aspartyl-tRNA(Asn)/glutamyl-tRNA(Gln) amidotransferase subunit C
MAKPLYHKRFPTQGRNMSLPDHEVKKIAHLARLDIPAGQLADYGQRLSGILDMVAALAKVPTGEVEPMSHPLDATQRLRPDAVTETDHREQYQGIAPATQDGLYLVPKVIE